MHMDNFLGDQKTAGQDFGQGKRVWSRGSPLFDGFHPLTQI
jgi:hypothetical protein